MNGSDGRKAHHGVAHDHAHPARAPRPTAARPHPHHLDEMPEDPVPESPPRVHHHLPRHGRSGPLRGAGQDPSACAASNRRVLHALGSLSVAVAGDPGDVAALAAATADRLPDTPVALILPAAGPAAVTGVALARLPQEVGVDAHQVGLAMDDLHLRPAGVLMIACDPDAPDLGEDARIAAGAQMPEGWVHWLMAGLAARAR